MSYKQKNIYGFVGNTAKVGETHRGDKYEYTVHGKIDKVLNFSSNHSE
jgi:hypothetical protein